MHCYGYTSRLTILTIPPTVSDRRSRFNLGTANSIPFYRIRPEPVKLTTRNAAGSLKGKASVNDDLVASHTQLSFYELLGVPESGSLVEVKHAYKQLARKYHPDVSPPGRVEEYTKRFIMVQEAYEILSDPVTRAIYDRDLARGLHFAFSTRLRYCHDVDQVIEPKNEWKTRWQSQLWELKRRSNCKEGRGNMCWAARMRQQMDELATEL